MVVFYVPTLSSHFKFMSPRVFDKIFNYSALEQIMATKDNSWGINLEFLFKTDILHLTTSSSFDFLFF